MAKRYPLYLHAILLDPEGIERALRVVEQARLVPKTPTPHQIALGVVRMWHRMLFRSETVGLSKTKPVRANVRASLLRRRPLRFPFLLREKAVAPLDFSGLLSSPDRVRSHLLGAHHDKAQFVYDLEMLRAHPGMLERVRDEARAVVRGEHPRAEWLKDLTVFEGYHEALLEACERELRSESALAPHEVDDPDISFLAYLRFCAAQPETPEETLRLLREGRYSIAHGRTA